MMMMMSFAARAPGRKQRLPVMAAPGLKCARAHLTGLKYGKRSATLINRISAAAASQICRRQFALVAGA